MQSEITEANINRVGLTVPCHWDKKNIESILKEAEGIVDKVAEISEIYGALAHGGPVGHGRSRNAVPQVSDEEALGFRSAIRDAGLDFTYLLNAPFSLNTNTNNDDLDAYLGWILHELKPDALTISSHELMKYVRERDKDIPIHISAIANVRKNEDLQRFLDVKPNRVVPHHDVGKYWDDLCGIVELGSREGIDVELLATESCLFHCPHRDAHYAFLSRKNEDESFHTSCNTRKISNPREFLLAGGTIRPEDGAFYRSMGAKYLKVTGRSKPKEWLPEVVRAYEVGRYEGNLIRLLGIDPKLEAEKWIFIDNRALDGFIESFPQTKDPADETRYAEAWMTKLYREGGFKMLDGTEYVEVNGELRLKAMGESTEQVINSEMKWGIR